MHEMSKWIILLGLFFILVGSVWYFFGDKLGFIGNLHGDFRYEGDNFEFYFPFTTMLILSVLINVGFRVYKYFFV